MSLGVNWVLTFEQFIQILSLLIQYEISCQEFAIKNFFLWRRKLLRGTGFLITLATFEDTLFIAISTGSVAYNYVTGYSEAKRKIVLN